MLALVSSAEVFLVIKPVFFRSALTLNCKKSGVSEKLFVSCKEWTHDLGCLVLPESHKTFEFFWQNLALVGKKTKDINFSLKYFQLFFVLVKVRYFIPISVDTRLKLSQKIFLKWNWNFVEILFLHEQGKVQKLGFFWYCDHSYLHYTT